MSHLISHNFYCDIRIIGSEFSANTMKTWMHSALYTIQAAVGGSVCVGDIFLAHFGLQLSIALNITAYLTISLLITVFPFSDSFFQQDKTPQSPDLNPIEHLVLECGGT